MEDIDPQKQIIPLASESSIVTEVTNVNLSIHEEFLN